MVAVAGPNGAGKTTLVGALAGDIRPAEGGVTLDGRALREWTASDLARRRAVMGADRPVAFAFTAEEVVMLGRAPIHGGSPTDEDRAIVAALLEAVDCAQLVDRVSASLSTGERQRIQLARAIAQMHDAVETMDDPEPRYLLLDEPTSSLDPAHQHTAMRLLRRQAEAGMGVLVVLHDLNLAAAYCDRIALMKDGRIVEVGSAADILRADLLERIFDIPMLVMPHPVAAHPLVVADADPDRR
jgi:iron complex transport system ATP-binding protein